MAYAINCSLLETIPNRKCNKLYTFGNFSQIAKSNKLFPLETFPNGKWNTLYTFGNSSKMANVINCLHLEIFPPKNLAKAIYFYL